jgi:hypothetical protein
MTINPWEEIHGFVSLGEYHRFLRYIEAQVADGFAQELPVDPSYGPGELFGGRWFQNSDTGEVWRLIEPDVPFKGLWEPVSQPSK